MSTTSNNTSMKSSPPQQPRKGCTKVFEVFLADFYYYVLQSHNCCNLHQPVSLDVFSTLSTGGRWNVQYPQKKRKFKTQTKETEQIRTKREIDLNKVGDFKNKSNSTESNIQHLKAD